MNFVSKMKFIEPYFAYVSLDRSPRQSQVSGGLKVNTVQLSARQIVEMISVQNVQYLS